MEINSDCYRVTYIPSGEEGQTSTDCASEFEAFMLVRALKSQGKGIVRIERPDGQAATDQQYFSWLCSFAERPRVF